MGKALGIIGLILLLIVGSCVGCMWFGVNKVTGAQDDFWAAVGTGDASKVMAQFHPELRKEVDEAVLAAWVKAVNEKLGAFDKLALDGIDADYKTTDQGDEFKTEGTAVFAKGEAKSLIRTIDGKVVQFQVNSDQIGDDWLTELDHTAYDEHARRYLDAVRAGEEDTAWAMMHEELQADVGQDKWSAMAQALAAKLGEGELKLARHEFVPGKKAVLALWYEAAGGPVKLVYRPVGMKMHLMGFSAD